MSKEGPKPQTPAAATTYDRLGQLVPLMGTAQPVPVSPAPGGIPLGPNHAIGGATMPHAEARLVEAVSAIPAAGTYPPPLNVNLATLTPNASIRYTLDGSEPSEVSELCTLQGITLKQSTILRARVYAEGVLSGPLFEIAYTIEAPAWKVLEPQESSDRVEHEVCTYADMADGWRMVAASVRGKQHAHNALWREDSFLASTASGWHILLVADGAGSCKLSRVGSRVACESMRHQLEYQLKDFFFQPPMPGATQPGDSDLLRLKQILQNAVRGTLATLSDEAIRRGVSFDDLSSTLIAVIHAEWNSLDLVASIQVGDGAAALWGDSGTVTTLGVADSGTFAGETKFLTSKGIAVDLDRRIFFSVKRNLQAIAVMTDGVADDFLQDKTSILFDAIFGQVTTADSPAETLKKWIKYDKKGSTDDRTLVVLFRERKLT